MAIKQKFIGILLIIMGILPFLLTIKPISDSLSNYTFLTYLNPGEILYQAILIILGILLIWTVKPKIVTHK